MIRLIKTLQASGHSEIHEAFKAEVEALDHSLLPLQEGMCRSSYVLDTGFKVVVLNVTETETGLRIKAAIFYSGVIAGSCCADDPTPLDEQQEYCELQFDIDRQSAETVITLL